jgi:Domain of unknown function (DUF1931)
MIAGSNRLEEFLSRSAGLDIDKSDMERLIDLMGRRMSDLLMIAVRNANYNNRDIVMEPDLPLTKGLLERLGDFRRHETSLDLRPVLEPLAVHPPPHGQATSVRSYKTPGCSTAISTCIPRRRTS